MTVAELIAELEKLEPTLEVFLKDDEYDDIYPPTVEEFYVAKGSRGTCEAWGTTHGHPEMDKDLTDIRKAILLF